jgi:Gas vesicle protein K/Gas vesicle protein
VSGSDLPAERRPGVALVDVLDATLGTGVTVAGDVVLSVADVDLVVLRLGALLASVQTLYGEDYRGDRPSARGNRPSSRWDRLSEAASTPSTVEPARPAEPEPDPEPPPPHRSAPTPSRPTKVLPDSTRIGPEPRAAPVEERSVGSEIAEPGRADRVNVDPQDVSRGLAQLILTVVELLRELMERQAIRRLEGGSLTDEQVEKVGLALKRLKEAVEKLKDELGLAEEDLNLDLGPLGRLL